MPENASDQERCWILSQQAMHYMNTQDHSSALVGFDMCCELMPQEESFQFNRAVALLNLHRAPDALEALLRLKHSENPEVWRARVTADIFLGRYEDALVDYDKCSELEPKIVQHKFGKAKLLLRLRRFEEALGLFDELIESDMEEKTEVLQHKAYALRELGRLEEELQAIDMWLKLNPKDKSALRQKVETLMAVSRCEAALEHANHYLQGVDAHEVDMLEMKAQLLDRLERENEAVSVADTILGLEPANDIALGYKAKSIQRNRQELQDYLQKQFEALKALEAEHLPHKELTASIHSRLPRDYKTLFELAVHYVNNKEYYGANIVLDTMFSLHKVTEWQPYDLRAQALASAGRITDALKVLEDCQHAARHPSVHLHMAMLHYRNGETDKALQHIDRALDYEKGTEERAYQLKSAVLTSLGRVEEAETAMHHALLYRAT